MKLTKYILTTIISMSFLCISSTNIFALEIVSRNTLGIDNNLISKDNFAYAQPTKIYVTQVKGYADNLKNNPESWIKLLYYYSITRLKLSDIPYNYLIDESGNIYEGRYGADGSIPDLEEGSGVMLVVYLSSSATLTPRASSSLAELVESKSYEYGINNKWDTVSLDIVKKDNALSYLKATSIVNTFKDSVKESFSDVKWSSEEHIEYKASIVSVEYNPEVVIGKTLDVKVKIKNENDFAWFSDSNYIYISTKDLKDSPYYITTVWDSENTPGHVEKAYISPGETVEATFKLSAKSKPGTYSEEYILRKSNKNIFSNSIFKVEFKITNGGYTLVETYSPQYGFVNIRECRWYSCKKIDAVDEGEVYILLKKEEGWAQIQYSEDKIGWVALRYLKEL